MYLSKAVFNLNNDKVKKAIIDANRMHKLVMSLFDEIDSETPRADMKVLYELTFKKNYIYIIIQSKYKPNFDSTVNMFSDIKIKEIDHYFNLAKKAKNIRIEILSEPYKKVKNLHSKNSRRKVLTQEEEKLDWFRKKLINAGCDIKSDYIMSTNTLISGNKGESSFKYHPSSYNALIQIKDPERFQKMCKNGIGSGKSYGMGMIKFFI